MLLSAYEKCFWRRKMTQKRAENSAQQGEREENFDFSTPPRDFLSSLLQPKLSCTKLFRSVEVSLEMLSHKNRAQFEKTHIVFSEFKAKGRRNSLLRENSPIVKSYLLNLPLNDVRNSNKSSEVIREGNSKHDFGLMFESFESIKT